MFVDEDLDPHLKQSRNLTWEQTAVVTYFHRSRLTYEGVLSLCADGYGVPAAMLCRSLIEDAVDVHWLTLDPNLASRRMHEYLRWKAHDMRARGEEHPLSMTSRRRQVGADGR